MNTFTYAQPKSVDEALALLGANPGEAEVLAGGTDLVNAMKDGVASPQRVVSLRDVEELRGIQADAQTVRIGAMTHLNEIVRHEAINQQFPALAHAAASIKSAQLRNMATVGGNLCQRPRSWYYRLGYGLLEENEGQKLPQEGDNRYHAIFGGGPAYYVHPSSLAPVYIALDAVLTLRGPNGQSREVPVAEFFRVPTADQGQWTALAPNEIVSQVAIPVKGLKNAHYGIKQRQCVDWPLVEAAVAFALEGDTARNAKVVLGHVAPTPWAAQKAAQALEGKPVNEETVAQAAEAATDGASPLSRNAYKVQLVKVAVKRAALAAAGKPVEA